MDMFTIGSYNLTQHITVPSYRVNENDVYEDWTDGTKTNHRHIFRTKVEGSFTVYFDDNDELDEFINVLNESKSKDGTYQVSVYLNNKASIKTTNVYINWEPVNNRPFFKMKSHDGYEVTIEEP